MNTIPIITHSIVYPLGSLLGALLVAFVVIAKEGWRQAGEQIEKDEMKKKRK